MNLVSLQDFAKLAEIETKQISVYLKRRKIIADKIIGEGKGRVVTFDVDHPTNKLFLQSRMIHAGNNKETKSDSITEDLSKIVNSDELKELYPEVSTEVSTPETEQKKEKKLNAYELDLELKRQQIRLGKQKEEINNLLAEKAKRRLISADIVNKAVSEVVQRYQASMVQGMDQLMRDTLNEIKADNVVLTKALTRISEIANEAIERAIIETRIAILNSSSDSISLSK